MYTKEKKINAANMQTECISKYKASTPWYCKGWYWLIVLGVTVLDWITLYTLFDPVLNGNMLTALVTTFAVTTVLDIYSSFLPSVLKRISKGKRNVIFAIALALLIIVIAALSVAFRISTGDVSTSTEEVELSSVSTTLLNVLLAGVPVASTLAMLYLSIQKDHYDRMNARFRNEQIAVILRAQKEELECSQDDIIRLEKIDEEGYIANVELAKAYALRDKIITRIKLAEALGDTESAEILSKSAVIPECIINELQPANTETME